MELVKVKTPCQDDALPLEPDQEVPVSDPPANALLTCPDCGGILEPTRPAWATTIEFVVAAEPTESPSARWKCLICGYHADAAQTGEAPPTPL